MDLQKAGQEGIKGTTVPLSERVANKNPQSIAMHSVRHWLRLNTSDRLRKLARKEAWNAHNRQEIGVLMAVSSPTLAYIATGISMDLVYAMGGTFAVGVGLIVSSQIGHGKAQNKLKD